MSEEKVEQPKVGELPPMEEMTDEIDSEVCRRVWDYYPKDERGKPEDESGGEAAASIMADLVRRERQLLAEQQVSAELRAELILRRRDLPTMQSEVSHAYARAEAAEASLAAMRKRDAELVAKARQVQIGNGGMGFGEFIDEVVKRLETADDK